MEISSRSKHWKRTVVHWNKANWYKKNFGGICVVLPSTYAIVICLQLLICADASCCCREMQDLSEDDNNQKWVLTFLFEQNFSFFCNSNYLYSWISVSCVFTILGGFLLLRKISTHYHTSQVCSFFLHYHISFWLAWTITVLSIQFLLLVYNLLFLTELNLDSN